MRYAWIHRAVFALAILTGSLQAATTYRWTGSSGANWFNTGNWDPAGQPGNGDTVIVTNMPGTILLTNLTASLARYGSRRPM